MNDALISLIRERYRTVCAQIAEGAKSSGRDPHAVQLVVVSKSQPLDVVRAAISAGITVLGENYAEEAVEKISALQETAVEWHMIGHVQSRKADMIAQHFTMLHSLDSVKLALRLDQYCIDHDRSLPVLLEFNVSGEESKFGLPAWDEEHWPALDETISKVLALSNLRVRGLMTMPPFYDDPELTRPYFQKLRRLQEYLQKRFHEANWADLSMGTSVDYITAIQEGATFVRVGQAILGPRTK
jgi:pyridoxal phosphate enzyme (YggS family)